MLYIEIKAGGNIIPPDLWQVAAERIFCQHYKFHEKAGSLRYLIVGYSIDGYRGVEGSWVDLAKGAPACIYEEMSSENCRKVITGRWK